MRIEPSDLSNDIGNITDKMATSPALRSLHARRLLLSELGVAYNSSSSFPRLGGSAIIIFFVGGALKLMTMTKNLSFEHARMLLIVSHFFDKFLNACH